MAVTGWFSDGFDYYATADLGTRWTASNLRGGSIQSTGGRRNSGYLKIQRDGAQYNGYAQKTVSNAQDVFVQAAVKFGASASSGSVPFIKLLDGASQQVELRLDTTGHLVVSRNGTTLGTSTKVLPNVTPFYEIEFAVHVASGTAGWAIVRVDGDEWLNITGVSTQATANAYANSLQLQVGELNQAAATLTSVSVDDLLLRTGSSLSSSDLLGDVAITKIMPTADSTGANWTPSAGTDHYAVVDDTTPNGDTDYDESSTVGAEQAFTFGDVTSGVTVPGVEVLAYARKTDAGARTIKFHVTISGTTYYSSAISLNDTFAYVSYVWAISPATSSAWTAAEVNGATFGYRLDS